MRILITNDDGISSPILPVLARRAMELGEVTVVAPKVEQSGKSHAIDFMRPIEIKRVDIGDGIRAFAMDSTPADCVRFAICGLKEHFDLVISGVNRGFNLGKDIVYSGTIGAIFEAARLDINGVAIPPPSPRQRVDLTPCSVSSVSTIFSAATASITSTFRLMIRASE